MVLTKVELHAAIHWISNFTQLNWCTSRTECELSTGNPKYRCQKQNWIWRTGMEHRSTTRSGGHSIDELRLHTGMTDWWRMMTELHSLEFYTCNSLTPPHLPLTCVHLWAGRWGSGVTFSNWFIPAGLTWVHHNGVVSVNNSADCVQDLSPGISNLASTLGQIVPKCDKSGNF